MHLSFHSLKSIGTHICKVKSFGATNDPQIVTLRSNSKTFRQAFVWIDLKV